MLDPTIKLYDAVIIKEMRQPARSGAGDIRPPQAGDVAYVIEFTTIHLDTNTSAATRMASPNGCKLSQRKKLR